MVKHFNDNGLALCSKSIKSSFAETTDEVTCKKCAEKMKEKPLWFKDKLAQEKWERQVDFLRLQFLPQKPKELVFEIGEEVVFGNMTSPVITEVFDNGQYYKIKVCGKQEDEFFAVSWMKVEKKDNINTEPLFTSEVYIQYSNYTLSALFSKVFFFGVNLEPDYQRGYVWNEDDKLAFIDSVFKDRELGRFLLIKLPYKEDGAGYEIVDGKQRLSTLIDYVSGKFSYRGKYFYQLHPMDRTKIEEKTITIGTLDEDTSREQLLDIFISLNTHGKVMSEEHLASVRKMRFGM